MENKLYIILNADIKNENDSLTIGMNVLLAYLRSDPMALECMRLIVLDSKGIIHDKPIYEDFNFEKIQISNDYNLKKPFRIIIDHLNSKSKDKVYPIVVCFSLVIPNHDFSEELYELNKITQGVNLLTSSEYYNSYKPYLLAGDNGNSKLNLAKLNLIELINGELLRDIFSYNYVGFEVSNGEFDNENSKKIPPPPPEHIDIFSSETLDLSNFNSMERTISEDELRQFVGKIFQNLNISSCLVICSKACLEGPEDIEWLIIPKKDNILPGQESEIIGELKINYKKWYRSGFRYFYKLKCNSKREFIFLYGKIDVNIVDYEIEDRIQPAIILNQTKFIEPFIEHIFNNIGKYPPNKLWWD